MKRHLLLALLVFPLIMSSCMDKGKQEESPVLPGTTIYAFAYQQHNLTMVPFRAAFCLNILLTEAVTQAGPTDDPMGDPQFNFNTVQATVGKDKYAVKSLFFPHANIESNGRGRFTVTYNNSGYRDHRNGKIIIDTKGTLLQELAEGEQWDITSAGNSTDQFVIASEISYKLSIESFTANISPAAADKTFQIVVQDFKANYESFGKIFTSMWDGDFSAQQSVGNGMTLEETLKSEFAFWGQAGGGTYSGADMNLEIGSANPLKYIPDCYSAIVTDYVMDDGFIETGRLKAKFSDNQDYNKENYPSPEVEVAWSSDRRNSQLEITYYYNGFSETFK